MITYLVDQYILKDPNNLPIIHQTLRKLPSWVCTFFFFTPICGRIEEEWFRTTHRLQHCIRALTWCWEAVAAQMELIGSVDAYTLILLSVSLSLSLSFPTHSSPGLFLPSRLERLTNEAALQTWAYPRYPNHNNWLSYFKLEGFISIYLTLTPICMQTNRQMATVVQKRLCKLMRVYFLTACQPSRAHEKHVPV